jgi:hypothetical protein
MILTFPFGAMVTLKTDFVTLHSLPLYGGYLFITWVGVSAGMKSFPSKEDIAQVIELAQSPWAKMAICPLVALVFLMNLDYISFFIRLGYVYALSLLLPRIIL